MQNIENKSIKGQADYFLDITSEVCPLTFVRTKLLIEKMARGSTAEVRLQGAEPLENVPRAVKSQGLSILDLTPEDPHAGPYSIHRLRMHKP
jgi:TusA-related sulfurtransferase